ncbi:unnamed protein product [Protopolystoma xenopodis]|uniref:Uncharacterized protein n=1 Tax=Protopolystoma xenopodis TaxID=117903 RepID=A0A448XK73_9PLAT|nr:unnamed protein product [Protopolystoma xenopodis]
MSPNLVSRHFRQIPATLFCLRSPNCPCCHYRRPGMTACPDETPKSVWDAQRVCCLRREAKLDVLFKSSFADDYSSLQQPNLTDDVALIEHEDSPRLKSAFGYHGGLSVENLPAAAGLELGPSST